MRFSFIGQYNVFIDNLEKDLIIYPKIAARLEIQTHSVFRNSKCCSVQKEEGPKMIKT